MKIAICDDNQQILSQMQSLLEKYFHQKNLQVPAISTFHCGEDLLSNPIEQDLIFLDIEMPGCGGIFTGNTLKQKWPNAIVIVVTSYAEYLDDAMRFHVFRYLSKPIEETRLFRNLDDALHLYNSSNFKIAIETKQSVTTVSSSEIIFIEARFRDVIVHTTKGDYASNRNMQYWLNTLKGHCFFLSHRSFLINLLHVTDFDKTTIHLYQGKLTAYLTRRKYTEFKNQYLLYLESTR